MQTNLLFGTALALALALVLGAAPAAIALEKGDMLGTDKGAVRAALERQGFEVRRIEAEADEGGTLEASAMKDGKRVEVHVDPKTGTVSKVEED